MGWSSRKEGSSQLKPSPIYLLLRGMEKAGCPQWKWGRELGVSEGAVEESLPLVSSKKAGQCASAPCLGQTGSRSAPRVDNGEGSGGEGVMGRTRGSSQKQFAISVDFQDTAESLLCCGQALFGTLSCGGREREAKATARAPAATPAPTVLGPVPPPLLCPVSPSLHQAHLGQEALLNYSHRTPRASALPPVTSCTNSPVSLSGSFSHWFLWSQ